VDPSSIASLGYRITIEKSKKGEKPILITLSKVLQLENSRGTVANAQRIDRKGTKRKVVDVHSEVDSSNIVSRKRQRKE
jgi:hypothetical protein